MKTRYSRIRALIAMSCVLLTAVSYYLATQGIWLIKKWKQAHTNEQEWGNDTFFKKIQSLGAVKLKLTDKKIGEGAYGTVYATNNKNFLAKILKNQSNEKECLKSELNNGNLIKSAIEKSIANRDFASAKALQRMGIPIKIEKFGDCNALILLKINGKSEKGIFSKKPSIRWYGNGYCENANVALSIARQEITILRTLHDYGLVNIDTRAENFLIDVHNDNVKVSMVDFERLRKIGARDFKSCGKTIVSPETSTLTYEQNNDGRYKILYTANEKRIADPKTDVFSYVIKFPYVLFGRVALNMFTVNGFRNVPNAFLSKLEKLDRETLNLKVKEMEGLYKTFEIDVPDVSGLSPQQRIRFMYYHIGFTAVQRNLNTKPNAVRYPDEVLLSLALMQMYATEPNPEQRISSQEVEDVLLNFEQTSDKWGNGQFVVDHTDREYSELVRKILPKKINIVSRNQPEERTGSSLENVSEERLKEMGDELNKIICSFDPGID